MTSKKRYLKGSRTPQMGGRGTTTVKREVLGQKRSGKVNKTIQKSSEQSAIRPSNK